jgi:DNA-binding transcriptional regulator YiaG
VSPQALRELRKRLMLTQEALAERVDVNRVTIARWESGERVPLRKHVRLLEAIAEEIRVG